jgi:hypothetical protein
MSVKGVVRRPYTGANNKNNKTILSHSRVAKFLGTFNKFPGFPEILVAGYRISCLFLPVSGISRELGTVLKFLEFCNPTPHLT